MKSKDVDLGVSWRTEVPQWLLLAAMFVAAAVAWPTAPEQIPVHWNLGGTPDRYGGKVEGLLLLPLLAIGIYLLMLFLPRIDPGRANYARFAGAYTVIRFCVLAMLAAIYLTILFAIGGHEVGIHRVVPVVAGLGLAGCGAVLGRVEPNWFVGIRTPWTLSSRLAWTRTHRLGGWVLTAGGLLLALAGLAGTGPLLLLAFGVLIVGMLWTIVYSYLVWRTDPDRTSPAGVGGPTGRATT